MLICWFLHIREAQLLVQPVPKGLTENYMLLQSVLLQAENETKQSV